MFLDDLGRQQLDLLSHRLVGGDTRVGVGSHRSVAVEHLKLLARGADCLERVGQAGGRFEQVAPVVVQRGEQLVLELGLGPGEGLVVGVEVLQLPGFLEIGGCCRHRELRSVVGAKHSAPVRRTARSPAWYRR